MCDYLINMLAMNEPDLTRQSIKRIIDTCQNLPYDFMLINNSGGEEITKIAEELKLIMGKRFKYFESEKNLGVAGGRNIAIKEFVENEDYKYLISVDNDIYPMNGWLKQLITPMELNPDIGMTAPVTSCACNKQQIRHDPMPKPGMALDLWYKNWIDQLACNKTRYWELEEKEYIIGFCTCVRRQAVLQAGLYDDVHYKLYGNEDADYCFTLKKDGYKCVINPYSVVYHYGNKGLNGLGPMGYTEWMASKRFFKKKWGFET